MIVLPITTFNVSLWGPETMTLHYLGSWEISAIIQGENGCYSLPPGNLCRIPQQEIVFNYEKELRWIQPPPTHTHTEYQGAVFAFIRREQYQYIGIYVCLYIFEYMTIDESKKYINVHTFFSAFNFLCSLFPPFHAHLAHDNIGVLFQCACPRIVR